MGFWSVSCRFDGTLEQSLSTYIHGLPIKFFKPPCIYKAHWTCRLPKYIKTVKWLLQNYLKYSAYLLSIKSVHLPSKAEIERCHCLLKCTNWDPWIAVMIRKEGSADRFRRIWRRRVSRPFIRKWGRTIDCKKLKQLKLFIGERKLTSNILKGRVCNYQAIRG